LVRKHQNQCIVHATTTITTTKTTTRSTSPTIPSTTPTPSNNKHDDNEWIETCWWVDHRRGDFVRPVAVASTSLSSSSTVSSPVSAVSSNSNSNSCSTLLYNGTMDILAAGTTPFYGGWITIISICTDDT
jgi:hypothetical protein